MCSTVGRAEAVLLRAAAMNSLAGSDSLLGKTGAAVQMAVWMLMSDAPAAEKGALSQHVCQQERSSRLMQSGAPHVADAKARAASTHHVCNTC